MLNNVSLMGRLCAAPELKHTQNGTAVTSFAIATERDYNSGSEKKTDFFDIIAWRSTAEFISKYFSKGQLIAISGFLRTETYEKDGQNRKTVRIVAEHAYFAGNKNGENSYEQPKQAENEDLPIIGDEDLPF